MGVIIFGLGLICILWAGNRASELIDSKYDRVKELDAFAIKMGIKDRVERPWWMTNV